MHGSVLVERHYSKSNEWVSRGAIPFDRVQRRSVDGIQTAQGWSPWNGLGPWGQERPLSRWGAGENEVSLRVVKRRYVLMVREWA